MRKRMIFIVPLAMIGMAVLMALGAWVVSLLWNWLLPPLFGWHAITLWQALGLLVLCRLLFGGSGMWHRGGGGWRRRRMEERCGNMTPEEREQMRQRMRERVREFVGFGPVGGENKGNPPAGGTV